MLKTLLKITGLLAALTWFTWVNAATMGGVSVMSALGQPLKAEILLGDIGKGDKSSIAAKLASVNDFKNAGIDYPYSLPKLTFAVTSNSAGDAVLSMTSTQPVNDPFVSLLVELNWSSGKMLREYTFLLDPPGFTAEQPKAAEVKPVEPMVPVQPPAAVAAAPIPDMVPAANENVPPVAAEPAPMVAAAPAEGQEQAQPEMAAASATEQAASEQAVAGEVKPAEQVDVQPLTEAKPAEEAPASVLVEKGDTLGRIADGLKPVDVSLERMLVALYRANVKQFDGKNMNRIRAGKILRMPEAGEIEKITQKAAVREIHAQVADWQEYRQKLAAAQNEVPVAEASHQEATGKISTAVAEQAPVIKENAKEVLKLSKGESLGDKTVASGKGLTKQEMLTAKADDSAAKTKQVQENKAKIEKLENISKEASKLVELKGQPVPEKPASAQEAAKPAVDAKPGVVTPPKPKAPVQLPPPAPVEEDLMTTAMNFLSSLLDDPILLGGIAAAVLGIGGLAFVMVRRKKGGVAQKKTKKNEDVGSATGSWRVPVPPSPDTGDFTQVASSSTINAVPAPVAPAVDDVDPISEADLFLNFGRDVQAEEILKDALSKTPGNNQVKLKLLSIYSGRKDVKSFSRYAQEVKDSGDTSAWERAAVMGREIDPSNPNYGGVKGEPRQQREPAKAEVDFDLGLGSAAAPAVSTSAAGADLKMDFDLFGGDAAPAAVSKDVDLEVDYAKTMVSSQPMAAADVDATSILSREVVAAAEKASPMDFDVSGILPGEMKELAETSSMDFDVSGSYKGVEAAESGMMDFDVSGSIPNPVGQDTGSMDFDISSNLSMPGEPPSDSAIDVTTAIPSMDFGDLKFEIPMGEPEQPVAAQAAVTKPAEDGGLSFSLDFPTSNIDVQPEPAIESTSKLDMDFGNINFNLDDAQANTAASEGKDEHWQEVATKLDLAKAYQEMGDADGAREILEEVVKDGDAEQRESAGKLLQQLTA